MGILDSIKEIVGSVINTFNNFGVTFSIRCPENYDLVKVVDGLELTRNY